MSARSAAAVITASAVITVSERHADIREIYRIFAPELARLGTFEVIVCVEGGFRRALREAAALRDARPELVRVLGLPAHCGESVLLRAGIAAARGETIFTVPAVLRVEPAAVGPLAAAIAAGADLACAVREPRSDSRLNRVQSRVFHGILGRLAGARFRDLSCGLRAIRRDAARALPIRGDLHRFLPLLAHGRGLRVVEVPARQHPADTGRRLFRPGLYLRRAVDMGNVLFLVRFRERPLRFFGLAGAALGAAAAGALALGEPFAAGLLGALAVQSIGAGLVAELISEEKAGRATGPASRPEPEAAEPQAMPS
jgi:hypothetical protein